VGVGNPSAAAKPQAGRTRPISQASGFIRYEQASSCL
jgi:hypothetical protein